MEAQQCVDRAIEIWNDLASAKQNDGRSDTIEAFPLTCEGESCGWVSLNFPSQTTADFHQLMGCRLLWWPEEIVSGKRVSVMSSRLGDHPEARTWWFDALRTLIAGSERATDVFVTVDGTAASRFVTRSCHLFDAAHLRINVSSGVADDPSKLVAWLDDVREQHAQTHRGEETCDIGVWLSPELSETNRRRHEPSPADRCLMAAAERIVVLSARSGGNIDQLIREHLTSNRHHSCIATGLKSTAHAVPDDLFERGLIPWVLTRPAHQENALSDRSEPAASRSMTDLRDGPVTNPELWLCHWTRTRRGPWPNQTEDGYLDSLILGRRDAERSALATILRVIRSEVIHTSALSRNCVSFTAVPLAEFRARRVYRKHLRRYDFEPWGIAIRRNVLIRLGAQPVEYRREEDGEAGAHTSWIHQPAQSDRINWTTEEEWRVPQEVSLADLNVRDVCIFVDSEDDAAQVRQNCQWPVVTVPMSKSPLPSEQNQRDSS